MCNDTYPPLQHHTEYFHCPEDTPGSARSSFSGAPTPGSHQAFIVSIVLPLFQNLHMFTVKSTESQKLKEGQLGSQEA